MTEVIDIWNQALSEIGARATVASLTESSKEAEVCALHYQNVRQSVLRMAPWSCARYQETLEVVESWENDPPDNQVPWLYSYQYPTNCLKVRYLLQAPDNNSSLVGAEWPVNWMLPNKAHRFLPGLSNGANMKVILSNVVDPIGVYTRDVEDPDLWDVGLSDAITMVLCAKIVNPMSGNVGMRQTWEQLARNAIMEARAQDGNEALPKVDHVPDWIAARSGGMSYAGFGMEQGPGIWYAYSDAIPWGN